MLKLYCRVNPRTELEKRDRAGLRFTRNWLELDGVDDATIAALQEDPYLEVSDSPTVLVEVAATTQAGAIETAQDPNNTPESEATDDGSTGEIAAEGSDTGTASPVTNEDSNDEQNPLAGESVNAAAVDDETSTAATADLSGLSTAAAATDTDGSNTQTEIQKETPVLERAAVIKGVIEVLNPNFAENWLADGRPSTKAIEFLLGAPLSPVSAAERDAIWAEIQAARSAG
ncbi:hypothetical protein [Methylomonas fluvii]|uniref:Mu-like prophage FluMu N-terminal domain-containing protein n=1 Tax=Methylomonas fluvii TaxID=1854564 RepID=A0ABR9DIL8_9GAMM|nr:hypothetical protein [Methylomonas fluvii]MBD9362912.1 hypothetical protein [Methylomonas fluvii]